jgi:transposase
MWTETTREQYWRDGLRYASDMTDAEWAMVEPLMPADARRFEPHDLVQEARRRRLRVARLDVEAGEVGAALA